jgi:hypothetical protein
MKYEWSSLAMNAEPLPSGENRTKKWPWHHLHWSTVIVVLLMAGFLATIEIGGTIKKRMPDKTEDETFQHGSPWIYLEREVTRSRDYDSAWCFGANAGTRKLSGRLLLFDILLAVTVVLLAATMLEHCLRKAGFTPIALLLLMLLLGGAIWWCVVRYNQHLPAFS